MITIQYTMHIDWQGWADAVESLDYSQTDFDGDTYYWRALMKDFNTGYEPPGLIRMI